MLSDLKEVIRAQNETHFFPSSCWIYRNGFFAQDYFPVERSAGAEALNRHALSIEEKIMKKFRMIKDKFSIGLILAVVLAMVISTVALAAVWTDQPDYAPGSVVTIGGNNDVDGAPGYVEGNTVDVAVTGPNGWTSACSATVGADGAWSCTITLDSDPAIAVGDYAYTATSTDINSNPISETGAFSDAGEMYHTCALTTSGGVKCWGYNSYGGLGDGTTTHRNTPVDVTGLTSGVAQIAVGFLHTCALTTSGGVKCWGYNQFGNLGDGTTTHRNTPVDVIGLTSGVAQISAGTYYTCAVMTSGGAKCWGYNGYGNLGDGTTTQRLTPVDVSGLTSGVAQISAGEWVTCAVTTGGGAKCWGANFYGQLGDGTTTQRLTPVDVSGLTSGVTQISAAYFHTCALMTSGGAKCWGYNAYGNLGDGTTTQRLTPVNVSGLTSGVTQIRTGFFDTCVTTTSGGAKCWGYNGYGNLGDGTTTQRLTPVDVSGLTSGVAQIWAGILHTCALTTTGGVNCWGYGIYGGLGNGSFGNSNTPVDVSGLTSGVVLLPDSGAAFTNFTPFATTLAATAVTANGATLNGTVNPNGFTSSASFQYSTNATLSTGVTTVPAQSGLTGTTAVAVNANVTGLTPSTTYYYRAEGTNANGTHQDGILSFTTLAAPADTTPPVITYALTPSSPDGANGWYQSNVTLVWSVTDPESAVTMTGCVDQNITADQAATPYSCSATSAGGSSGPVDVTIKRDATPPTDVNGAAARLPDHNGWYNAPVDVTFSGLDATSGIASCTSATFSGPDNAAASAAGSCTDNAGNAANGSFALMYDASGPSASLTVTAGTAGANGWYTSDVTVSTSGSDSVSGIESCTLDQSQTAETAGTSFDGSCTNGAGLTTNATPLTIKLDKTAPTVSLIGGPADGGSYYFGSVPAAPTCSASDALSGLDGSCTVSDYSALVGPQTVTATAYDMASNQNSDSASYTVLAWTTNGFFQPVDMGGVWNTVKGGSTVPLKFKVFAGSTELTSTSIVNQPLTATQSLCSGGPTDDIELTATGATSLRYDITDGQFIYNWQTPRKPGYCYVVTITMADGSTISANFKLK